MIPNLLFELVIVTAQQQLNENKKHKAVEVILPEKNKTNWNGDREDQITLKNHGNTFQHPVCICMYLTTINILEN